MDKKLGQEPAFPVSASYSDDNPGLLIPMGGMNLRTYIATQAMVGLLSARSSEEYLDETAFAQQAVKCADALLIRLNEQT